MLSLREIGPEDAETVTRVVHQSFEELRGRLDPPSGAHAVTPNVVWDNLRDSKGFVAEEDGRAIGCVFCKQDRDSLYLYRLGVLPDCRRRGVAQALIGLVEEEAQRLGLNAVTLATRETLTENVNLYLKYGFEVESVVPHPRSDTSMIVVMRKNL